MARRLVRKLCPSEAELSGEVQTNVPCLVEGCEKVFKQGAARRLHMVKVHRVLETAADRAIYSKLKKEPGTAEQKKDPGATEQKKDPGATEQKKDPGTTEQKKGAGTTEPCGDEYYEFHCPVTSCYFNINSPRHFTAFKNLKNHYQKSHGEKKFECQKCNNKYSLERDLRAHLKKCDLHFYCRGCNKFFDSMNGLQAHKESAHPDGISYQRDPQQIRLPVKKEVETAPKTHSEDSTRRGNISRAKSGKIVQNQETPVLHNTKVNANTNGVLVTHVGYNSSTSSGVPQVQISGAVKFTKTSTSRTSKEDVQSSESNNGENTQINSPVKNGKKSQIVETGLKSVKRSTSSKVVMASQMGFTKSANFAATQVASIKNSKSLTVMQTSEEGAQTAKKTETLEKLGITQSGAVVQAKVVCVNEESFTVEVLLTTDEADNIETGEARNVPETVEKRDGEGNTEAHERRNVTETAENEGNTDRAKSGYMPPMEEKNVPRYVPKTLETRDRKGNTEIAKSGYVPPMEETAALHTLASVAVEREKDDVKNQAPHRSPYTSPFGCPEKKLGLSGGGQNNVGLQSSTILQTSSKLQNNVNLQNNLMLQNTANVLPLKVIVVGSQQKSPTVLSASTYSANFGQRSPGVSGSRLVPILPSVNSSSTTSLISGNQPSVVSGSQTVPILPLVKSGIRTSVNSDDRTVTILPAVSSSDQSLATSGNQCSVNSGKPTSAVSGSRRFPILPKPHTLYVPVEYDIQDGRRFVIKTGPTVGICDPRPAPCNSVLNYNVLRPLKPKGPLPGKINATSLGQGHMSSHCRMMTSSVSTGTEEDGAYLMPRKKLVTTGVQTGGGRKSRSIAGTQTVKKPKVVTETETQTSGDFILRTAMKSADIKTVTKSCGTNFDPSYNKQQSATQTAAEIPKKSTKRRKRNISSHISTQTSGEPVAKRHRARKLKTVAWQQTEPFDIPLPSNQAIQTVQSGDLIGPVLSVSETGTRQTQDAETVTRQTQYDVTTDTLAYSTMETQTLQSLGISHNTSQAETQTQAFLDELEKTLAENISTQTFQDPLGESISTQTFPNPFGESISTQTFQDPLGESISTQTFDSFLATTDAENTGSSSLTSSFSSTPQRDPIIGSQSGHMTHFGDFGVQTDESTLPNFLSSSSVQTSFFDDSAAFSSIETQTMDDMFEELLLSNMHTQTADNFFDSLGLTDIQTQTYVTTGVNHSFESSTQTQVPMETTNSGSQTAVTIDTNNSSLETETQTIVTLATSSDQLESGTQTIPWRNFLSDPGNSRSQGVGTNSCGTNSVARATMSVGINLPDTVSVGTNSVGTNSVGINSVGINSVAINSVDAISVGTDSRHSQPAGTSAETQTLLETLQLNGDPIHSQTQTSWNDLESQYL